MHLCVILKFYIFLQKKSCMPHTYKIAFVFLGIFLFLTSFYLSAQRTVSGRITDAIDGAPIHDVQIYIANTTIGTTSGENGNYSISVPIEGSFDIIVSHVGYQPVFHKIDVPKPFHQIDFALKVNEISEVTAAEKIVYKRDKIEISESVP